MSVSTHVLDAATGRPASGVPVRLLRQDGDGWVEMSAASTDTDGRIAGLAAQTPPGTYRLRFDTAAYQGAGAFFPEVVITFRLTDAEAHHHVPLLLSPFAYSTYRGS